MQIIDHEKMKEKLDNNEDFVFLNVLPNEEYEKEHIPDSDNIPYNDDNFVEKVQKKAGSKDKEVIVYCADEECDASVKAAGKLEDAGFTNIIDFSGGMEEWKDAGYEIEGQKKAA